MRRREFIHVLMGRPGRLDVAAWISREVGDDYFTERDAVLALGDNQGEVRSNLLILVKAGLLERTDDGRPHYRKVESPVWEALARLADAVQELVSGRAKPRLERDLARGLAARKATAEAVTIPRRGSR